MTRAGPGVEHDIATVHIVHERAVQDDRLGALLRTAADAGASRTVHARERQRHAVREQSADLEAGEVTEHG